MATKFDPTKIKNPALAYMSVKEDDSTGPEEVKPEPKATPKAAPASHRQSDRELKKRVTFAMTPSLHEDLSKLAKIENTSVSQLISDISAAYIVKNYRKLK